MKKAKARQIADLAAIKANNDVLEVAMRILMKKDAVIDVLVASLENAVANYGRPGGPWNVPSSPGSWITKAREALNFAHKARLQPPDA